MFSRSAQSIIGLLMLIGGLNGCRSESSFWAPPQAEEPSDADLGQWLSLDLSPDGRPVAAYYDRTFDALGFAVGTVEGSRITWEHERVDAYPASNGMDPGDRGEHCSMKVMPDGGVWIAYFSRSEGALYATHRAAGPRSWSEPIQIDAGIAPSPAAGLFTSMAVDANGQPVVAYHDASLGTLNIAHYSGQTWSTEVIEGDDVGAFASLIIVDNIEYIAYYNAKKSSLDLSWGTSGSYQTMVVDGSADVGQWPSLAFQGDSLWIAYHDVEHQDLKVASGSPPAQFALQTVDTARLVGADTALFFNQGLPSVVYFDGYNNDLKQATQVGQSWLIKTIAGENQAVGYHNEVLQVDGQWWAGSYDFTHRTLFTTPLR